MSLIIARSYGAIYERNAINAGMPVMIADLLDKGLLDGQEVTVDMTTGRITWDGGETQGDRSARCSWRSTSEAALRDGSASAASPTVSSHEVIQVHEFQHLATASWTPARIKRPS